MIEETKQTPFLTTVDNVWNPFTNFDEWFAFDITNQHYSSQRLAKLALVSPELSDEENRQEIERAIDRIIELDPTKEYVKVYKDTYESDMAQGRQLYDKQIKLVNQVSK